MGVVFDPQRVVSELKSEVLAGGRRPMRTKEDYLTQYLEVTDVCSECVGVYVCVHVSEGVHTCTCVYMQACMCVCMYTHVCMHACVHCNV